MAEQQSPNPNYLVRLFRGDVPLAITYWVYGVAIGGGFTRLLFTAFERNYLTLMNHAYGKFVFFGGGVLIVAYQIFMIVAIWRSANKYNGRLIWRLMAQGVVILGIALFIGGIVSGFRGHSAMANGAAMINHSLPYRVDKYTTLDQVRLIDGDVYYSYTVQGIMIKRLGDPKRHNIIRTHLAEHDCADHVTRKFLDAGHTMYYVYRDAHAKQLFSAAIKQDDCISTQ